VNPGLILRLGMLRWGNQASDLVGASTYVA